VTGKPERIPPSLLTGISEKPRYDEKSVEQVPGRCAIRLLIRTICGIGCAVVSRRALADLEK
jgi:hypothetical protein